MADRVVNVRLRLDSSQWQAGSRRAEQSTQQMARSAQRAAVEAGSTFSNVGRQAQVSLSEVQRAALRSSMAVNNGAQVMSRQTAQSAVRASQATRQVVAETGRIPAAFRAAGAAGTSSLQALTGQVGANRQAWTQLGQTVTRQSVAGRDALQQTVRAATRVQTTMSEATVRAAAGTGQLSLANRLALAEVTQASRVAAQAQARAAARVSTSASLAAAGARRASEASAAAMARANARAAAASSGSFARVAARASAMGSSITAGAERSQKALRATRAVSIGLVAAFGLAVYASSKFEKAMSGVKAATQAGADELGKLRQAAIAAGGATQYSATQAAEAETELAKAGVSTSDILGGALRGTLSLASAGQMDVADSAVVAAKAMNSFGLQGSDMAHIADVIAAAAGKSATDVHGMSLAFAQSSLLAHQTGLTLEQTAGSLALFAQNGLVGSDAGTSLKTMLLRLTPQSKEAAAMMDKLGFSAYDSNGRFVGLSETAARMQAAFGKLTPEARNAAMATIFGSDAARAATIVYKSGADGINTWTKAANDQGYASRYAATQTDNLAGDLQRLKSALETALIQSGSAANGTLRGMAKALTDVVRWYSALPPGVQKSVTVLGGFLGVIGLIGSGLLLMLPRIMAVRTELVAMGVTAARTRVAMMGLGRLSLVVAGLEAASYASTKLSEAMKDAPPNATKLTAELVKLAQSSKATAAGVTELDGFGDAVARIAHPGTMDRVNDVTSSILHLGGDSTIGSLTESKDKITALDEALAGLVQGGNQDVAAEAFAKMAAEANASGTSTEKLKTLLPQYADALTGVDTQSKLAADGTKQLGDDASTTADALQDQRTEAEKLTDALKTLNGVNISAAEEQIGFRQSLADLSSAVKENGHSLDITTDKGRKVKSAFLDAAKAAQSHAQAVAEQKDSVDAGNKVLEQDVAALKRTMRQAGFSEKAIRDLTKAYAQLPAGRNTQVAAPGAVRAANELDAVRKKVADVPAGKSITVRAPSAAAIKALQAVGYKTKTLPNGRVRISVPTSNAQAALRALQDRINALDGRIARVTIRQSIVTSGVSSQAAKNAIDTMRADGGIVRRATGGRIGRYAAGGNAQWMPFGGAVTGPGTGTSDSIPAWVSNGEYVVKAAAVQKYGVTMFDRLNAMRFASGGSVGRYAGGGFTYSPTEAASTFGAGAGMDHYTAAVQKLKDAWSALNSAITTAAEKAKSLKAAEAAQASTRKDGARKVAEAERNLNRVRSGKHTAKQLAAAEDRLTNARAAAAKANKAAEARADKASDASKKANAAVKKDRFAVYAADAALGLKKGAKAPSSFNLHAYQQQLAAAAKANAAWEKNLDSIGKRAGADVEETLRGMGEDGQDLVAALAKSSGKQFTDIVNNLKKLAPTAKATLADYTKQMSAATSTSKTFQDNLLKLASMGYGDLAAQLAAQGDENAQAVAAAAVASPSTAASANSAASANASLLSGDDVSNALAVVSALKSKPGVDFAGLVTATGLDVSTLLTLLPKIKDQVKALPDANKSALAAQWTQLGFTPMARGGILDRPTAVLAAEAGTRESWIPWNGSARSAALLTRTAAAMGYQLVPAARWGGSSVASAQAVQEVARHQTIHLHGAHQTSAEQAADLMRHMVALT